MNLAILNTQQQEQKTIEEMKKYTDLFREEKSLDQTAVIELRTQTEMAIYPQRG